MKKITEYLFVNKDKKALMESMGYNIEDSDYIYKLISYNARNKFMMGDYELGSLSATGQKINIVVELNGKGTKSEHKYKFKTGWTAYPYYDYNS